MSHHIERDISTERGGEHWRERESYLEEDYSG
jgi:hypothetical protein